MPEYHKPHIIPAFYLQQFSAPDSSPKRPYLWVRSTHRRDWHRQTPSQAARMTEYYTVTDESGRGTRVLERRLQVFENSAAPILRERIFNGMEVNEEARRNLARFFASMSARAPARHRSIDEAVRQDLKNRLLVPRGLEKSVGIRLDKSVGVVIAFAAIEPLADLIARMGWTFLRSEGDAYFVTSDNPVFLMDLATNTPVNSLAGFLSVRTDLTMPLGRNWGLLASWRFAGTRFVDVSAIEVRWFNIRSVYSASRIFAATQDFPP